MRLLAIVFVVLLAALQYPMWLGKGGWLQVREIDRQVGVEREANAKLKARNDALDARNFFDQDKSKNIRNNFGASLPRRPHLPHLSTRRRCFRSAVPTSPCAQGCHPP